MRQGLRDIVSVVGDRRLVVLLGAGFGLSFLEAAGIVASYPFLASLVGPDLPRGQVFDVVTQALWGVDANAASVTRLGMLFLVLFILRTSAGFAWRRWCAAETSRIEYQLRVRLFHRLLGRRTYAESLGESSHVATHLVGSAVPAVSSAVGTTLEAAVQTSLAAILMTGLALIEPLVTASVVIAITAIYLAVFPRLRRTLRAEGARLNEAERRLTTLTQAAALGFRELRLSAAEAAFRRRFAAAADGRRRAAATIRLAAAWPPAAVETALVTAVVVMAFWGDRGPADTTLLPALAIAFVALYRAIPGINRLMGVLADVARHESTLAELRSRLAGPDPQVPVQAPVARRFRNVRLDQVTFAYAEGKPALDRLSLSVRHGEAVAIVGPSGAGKSTFLNVLMGFLQPGAGDVTADGTSIFADLAAWQSGLAYVPQAPFFLNESIAQNIVMGDEAATADKGRLLRALEQAGLRAAVEAMPKGLDTVVGENAAWLSSGQRQRLGLARALFLERPLLLLDEPTSHLDPVSASAIRETLVGLKGQRTLIIVSHQSELLDVCDRVFHIEGGRLAPIAASGPAKAV